MSLKYGNCSTCQLVEARESRNPEAPWFWCHQSGEKNVNGNGRCKHFKPGPWGGWVSRKNQVIFTYRGIEVYQRVITMKSYPGANAIAKWTQKDFFNKTLEIFRKAEEIKPFVRPLEKWIQDTLGISKNEALKLEWPSTEKMEEIRLDTIDSMNKAAKVIYVPGGRRETEENIMRGDYD